MDGAGGVTSQNIKMKGQDEVLSEEEAEEEWNSDDGDEDDDDTIERIRRAHYAQAAAMSARRRSAARPRPLTQKRKLEAVKNFHDFTKKLKKDTGISIRSIVGRNILDLSDLSSDEDSKSDSDGLSEEEFIVNPSAVEELNAEDNSYIDPETGDIIENKKVSVMEPPIKEEPEEEKEEVKTLSISDIINEGDLDLTKNVEIAEVEGSELCTDKSAAELLGIKEEENSQDFALDEKSKDNMEETEQTETKTEEGSNDVSEEKKEGDDEKKSNPNALNIRRNIREVMDEKQLDASTLAAQRQESERLARVQEQQRIIREVQRQIAINRQNKVHQKTMSLLQGGSSVLKKAMPGNKLNLSNQLCVKLASGEMKKTGIKQNQLDFTKISRPIISGQASSSKVVKPEMKTDKKEVVEIVSSSSGDESSSSSSDSDDCIMLSDSEVPPSPEAEDDPNNSGLHVNDTYNVPDEQGRVLINIGHPESEEDIFLAPQIARIIKPHQIGGVRFLYDNIIESTERFSTSTGFGCILAHSMGLGKTLQIVCFSDIFLRHTSSKTILCIMPINTLQNWVAEFNKWLPVDASNCPIAATGEVRTRNFPIYVLNDSHKTLLMRAKVVKDWTTTGGVLMIGYELYRLLSMKKDKKPRKKRKTDKNDDSKDDKKGDKPEILNEDTQGSDMTSKQSEDSKEKEDADDKDDAKKDKEDSITSEDKRLLDEMYEALVKPGPDLVICDEGHRIKNSHSNISYALKQMRTKRRVVLTGYPLQNNLLEYWCMVDFVRPNYLGSKTEFCNMFERPIQNGQCIDSTPQDIRLMRYRAHVLHSLLVGFVQRRSHAVLQSTLPQKEEFVMLIRLTPLQRQLYNRFMNEVVRSTSVPNPLKAFAICCKIWNHPDVLYNFLKKRSEASAAIEEDLDLEEIGGVTKSGRTTRSKTAQKRGPKPRGGAKGKKPAATIPPNTSGNMPPKPEPNFGNQYQTNGPPYGPPNYPEGSYPPYPNYQNQGSGFYPPNQGYNQNYGNKYYQQPYGENYPNQYPTENTEQQPQQGYNQNYWQNSNYYGNPDYYNNTQYPNNPPPTDYRGNSTEFNATQQYPPNYPQQPQQEQYTGNAQSYPPNQAPYNNQQQQPYAPPYPNQQPYPGYDPNTNTPYPSQTQNYPNQSYPPPYNQNSTYPNQPSGYNQQFPTPANNYPNYQPPNNQPSNTPAIEPSPASLQPTPEYPDVKPNLQNDSAIAPTPYPNSYNYNNPNGPQNNAPANNYNLPYDGYSNDIKPSLENAGSPVTSWPITGTIKTEVDRIKNEEKAEIRSESDGEVKIEDLDTKTLVKTDDKKEMKNEVPEPVLNKPSTILNDEKDKATTPEITKSPEIDEIKKTKARGKGKDAKKAESKRSPKGKGKTKSKKDKKSSKENKNDSESEESEKEEKMKREDELALVKRAEEMTYDWATELLKDYIPGVIENSAKMELFFYILTESIKLGDRILLFSQSLFTLNLIEDFLERNYIPGTNCLWQRNTSYYRLDGSTHALEREKLINEFNANPNIYLFLVSTRAGSLGINLVGANRVIVFDASWNPCHDTQAVCRVYRYGQKKPCFVYRFVMDCCLEKKIYDRQINKQGMADRVVDECNPDAVLSMKEITNLCFDNDEKETAAKDLSEFKDKYIDVIMQGIITQLWSRLSKEPFQHESLLVDRKEKKLSSAEKRLAQRGYELEKKAASNPKSSSSYRLVRTADGSVIQRPVASVRPMQLGSRWIPADVWRRQGMTAQEMTLPLDVVIPTNSAEKTNIVLKAGQRVMVLKSPKGIYMQLESGKIIAIKTSLKGLGQKAGDGKDGPVGKKVLGARPSTANLPGSLKNNSAITITSKSGVKPGMQRIITRPMLQNKVIRPFMPGSRPDIRAKLAGDFKSYAAARKMLGSGGRIIRPVLPGSVSITKITKKSDENDTNKAENETDIDTQVLDSEDEENDGNKTEEKPSEKTESLPSDSKKEEPELNSSTNEAKEEEPIVLTTDEKLPSEDVLDKRTDDENAQSSEPESKQVSSDESVMDASQHKQSKINLLKNYRHQRLAARPLESSLSQLEKTAISLNTDGVPAFRKNLDDITQSYSPGSDERPAVKSRKKRPTKSEAPDKERVQSKATHSVSNLLGPPNNDSQKSRDSDMSSPLNIPPMASSPSLSRLNSMAPDPSHLMAMGTNSHTVPIGSSSHPVPMPSNSHSMPMGGNSLPMGQPGPDPSKMGAHPHMGPQIPPTGQGYGPPGVPHETPYGQYPPGYGMGYPGYPNPPYYGGYPAPFYPGYPPTAQPYPPQNLPQPSAPTPEGYLPPNQQW